jgi:hypothetical protein
MVVGGVVTGKRLDTAGFAVGAFEAYCK